MLNSKIGYLFFILFSFCFVACKDGASKVDNNQQKEKQVVDKNGLLLNEKYTEMVEFHSYGGMPIVMGEEDERREEISNDFSIAKYEITGSFYTKVVQESKKMGYSFANERENLEEEDKYKPISNITWFDAIVWCNALSTLKGFSPVYFYEEAELKDAKDMLAKFKKYKLDFSKIIIKKQPGYRLPFEKEWETAARYLGSTKPSGDYFVETNKEEMKYYFSKGNAMSGTFIKASDCDECREVAWFLENSDTMRHNVGEKKANYLGIHDMSGNVSEWCFDGGEQDRITKGGAYNLHNREKYLQVGHHFDDEPHLTADYIGFRILKQ